MILFLLNKKKHPNGGETYVKQLERMYALAGVPVRVFRVDASNLQEALALAADEQGVIAFSVFSYYRVETLALIGAGVPFLFHGPFDLAEQDLCSAVAGKRCYAIRKSLVERLVRLGLDAHYLPHPYERVYPTRTQEFRAVCISRLASCKHQDTIAAANAVLPPERAVHMFGGGDTLYGRSLHKRDKDWRRYQHKPFANGEGAQVAARAEFVVDLSFYPVEGGGTQYTFFEAWDAGSLLVLDWRWTKFKGDVTHSCAEFIQGWMPLAKLLLDGVPPARADELRAGGEDMLSRYSPEKLYPVYERTLL